MDSAGQMLIACSSCAKSKVKCDKQFPCSRCTNKQIVCQSRSGRISSENLLRRAHRPLNFSREVPQNFHRNGTYKISGKMNKHAMNTGYQIQWTTSHPVPDGLPRSYPTLIEAPIDFEKSVPTDTQPDPRIPEAYRLVDGLQQPSPDLSFPPTPVAQDPRIENYIQTYGAAWDQYDNHEFPRIWDEQSSSNLEAPSLTEFMLPMSSNYDISRTSYTEKISGPNSNISVAWNASPRSLDPCSNHSSSAESSPITRRISLSTSSHQHAIQEHQSVIAAQNQWLSFRCNPITVPSVCPKTARIYLEGLEQTLKNQDAWSSWCTLPHNASSLVDREISVEPFMGSTREKLLAITQTFLQKSLKRHPALLNSTRGHESSSSHFSTFIILPPSNVLEYFLRVYVRSYELYYPSLSAGKFRTNELIQPSNGSISSLLLLLMIAHGAMAALTVETRYLSSGLTEACRISLFDEIEKSGLLSLDPIVLRCALLLTNLLAWSGDKWHMDIAMGQRGMYLTMLENAGMLNFQEASCSPLKSQANPGQAWEMWKEQESRSRLIYSWVTVDQELSLFHDTAPLFSVASLHATMPDSDRLWHAKSASEWVKLLQETSGTGHKRSLSLCDLFGLFMITEGKVEESYNEVSAVQLRLLLHPLQSMVCHFRQLLSCLPPGQRSQHNTYRTVFHSTTRVRLNEVQLLLKHWYALSVRSVRSSTEFCPVSCANLVMYHLISLNTIIDFVVIERLARCEGATDIFQQFLWLQLCCLEQTKEIYFHCGQILRLLRSMPQVLRPLWWAAAMYRITLIFWVNSMANMDTHIQDRQSTINSGNPFAIDGLEPEHPSMSQYLNFREGIPTLSKRDGSGIPLTIPTDILTHCVEIIHEESTTRFAFGIKNRLHELAERWRNYNPARRNHQSFCTAH